MIISTIGSHSALQILHGAKEEGFKTRVYVIKGREDLYKRYPVADEIHTLENYDEMLEINDEDTVLIPHGTLIATLGERVVDIPLKIFGNRQGMIWEMKRELNLDLLAKTGIRTPRSFSPADIDSLCIVKFPGAKGGAGYFLCSTPKEYQQKSQDLIAKGKVSAKDVENAQIQEYIVGVTMYPHYFYSPLQDKVEMLGIDRRYETNVDALGRLSMEDASIDSTYTVVGNQPLVVRESLLPKILEYGDNLRAMSEKLFSPGLIGPYCLELALTPDEIIAFEFTSRIVAGTTLYVQGSPYSRMLYGEDMSMAKRIAREIKFAIDTNRLEEVLS